MDLAWAAGIIDADGYIGLLNSSVKRLSNGKPKRYPDIRVSVDNYDVLMVDKLHSMFDGSRFTKSGASVNRRKDIQRWMVASKKAESCLRLIVPYLVTKHKQAELALKFRDMVNSNVTNVVPLAKRHLDDVNWVHAMKKLKV